MKFNENVHIIQNQNVITLIDLHVKRYLTGVEIGNERVQERILYILG